MRILNDIVEYVDINCKRETSGKTHLILLGNIIVLIHGSLRGRTVVLFSLSVQKT